MGTFLHEFLQGLTPTESTDYSLRKAIRKLTHVKNPPPLLTSQGKWPRSNVKKAHAFTKHIADVFQPYLSENEPEEEEALIPYQIKPPVKRFKGAEIQEVINNLNPRKSFGYNLMTGKILEE
jgi:hypothetical protein